jgi:signal transduction histidine kinase
MSDIVWAINPGKDRVDDLTRRMRQHAQVVFESRNICLEFNAPKSARELKLNADTRRNVYLIFKESINNIIRHSDARSVQINFEIENSELLLSIIDYGKGFDATVEYDGNGLISMKTRAAESGGSLEISSPAGGGTMLTLRFPMAHGIGLKRLR